MNHKAIICPVCGSSCIVEKSGRFYCQSCNHLIFDIKKEKESELARSQKNILLCEAENELKLSPPNFDEAENKFKVLIKEFPEWYAGYWGLLRSRYGIKYEIDEITKEAIPLCYESEYKDFRSDKLYINVLKLIDDNETRSKITSEANRIAITWKEWEEKAKKLDYDIFLSFKSEGDNSSITYDKTLMQDLYTHLVEQGYKVFFAPKTMRQFIGEPYYDAYIFNALDKSKVLIVCGSKSEYFNSPWVENEWMRFLKLMQKGEKLSNSLLVLCGDFNITRELDKKLVARQCYPMNSRNLFQDITNYIENIFKKLKKRSFIQHVDVKKVSQGYIKSIEKNNLKLVTLSKREIKKANFKQNFNIEVKELNKTASGLYTPTIKDKLKAGFKCLSAFRYEEASSFFEECLEEDKANGQSWLGLFCSNIKNDSITKDFTNRKISNINIDKSTCLLIGDNIELIGNIIEFADNQEVAEFYLKYFSKIILRFLVEEKETIIASIKLFEIIISYNSYLRYDSRDYIISKLEYIFKNTSLIDFNSLCILLSNVVKNNDVEDYLKNIDALVNVFIKNDSPELANKWNDEKIKHYEGDLNSVYTSISLCTGKILNEKQFFEQNLTSNIIAKNIINIVSKNIDKLSNADAQYLIKYVIKHACFCIDKLKEYKTEILLSNFKKYYLFVSRYEFSEREKFFATIMNSFETLCEIGDYELIDDILEYQPNRASDFLISSLLKISKCNLRLMKFDYVNKYCKKIFDIQENNFDALLVEFLAHINYSKSHFEKINWEYINKKNLENVLSYAPTINSQQKLVNRLIDLCCLACKSKQKMDINNCSVTFDLVIKYLSNDAYSAVDKFSNSCLNGGYFEFAKKYAEISLEHESRRNFSSRYVLLLTSLGAKNDEEFLVNEKFHKNLKEYKDLILSCSDNEHELKRFTKLADDNVNNVNKIIKDRDEYEKNDLNNKRVEELDNLRRQNIKFEALENEFKGDRITDKRIFKRSLVISIIVLILIAVITGLILLTKL